MTKPSYSKEPSKSYEIPLLYNIENDPSEKYDVSQQNPEIIEEIKKEMEKHKSGVISVPSLMKQIIPENQ
jgi:peptide deformylase